MRRIVRLRGGQCQGDQLISLSMRGLRNELEARCTDSASVSPMCLTCDVKVAGTGACKAVLNICQASSAPRFIFRSIAEFPPSSRSFVVRSRRNVSTMMRNIRFDSYQVEYIKRIYFSNNVLFNCCHNFYDEFRNRYIYASLYVTRYTLCISSVYTKNWWNLKYLLE